MKSNAHTPITFMVYGIPNHADISFLQMLFQQKVQRSVYFGSGPTRFALVELNDVTFEKQLAEAVQHHRLVHDARRTQGEEEEAEEDEKQAVAAATAERPAHRAVAYLLKVKWGTEPIHIVQSAVRIDELYETGGVVRDHEPEDEFQKRKSEMNAKGRNDKRRNPASFAQERGDYNKRPREEGSGAEGPTETAKRFPKDCCQKCGSKDHFTRNCDGSGPGPEQAAAPAAQTPEGPTGAPKSAYPKDCCQKCGSRSHFTRNCDGSGPAPEEAGAAPSPAAPAAPVPASHASEAPRHKYPKDCCQKCGSKDHFTRNCDGGGTATAKPAPAASASSPAAAPTATATTATSSSSTSAAPKHSYPKDCCQKCGSKDHFTRNCDGGHPVAQAPAPQEQRPPEAPEPPKDVKAARVAPTKAAERPAQAAPPSFARTSKDQCKHCGSVEHLSRLCPNK